MVPTLSFAHPAREDRSVLPCLSIRCPLTEIAIRQDTRRTMEGAESKRACAASHHHLPPIAVELQPHRGSVDQETINRTRRLVSATYVSHTTTGQPWPSEESERRHGRSPVNADERERLMRACSRAEADNSNSAPPAEPELDRWISARCVSIALLSAPPRSASLLKDSLPDWPRPDTRRSLAWSRCVVQTVSNSSCEVRQWTAGISKPPELRGPDCGQSGSDRIFFLSASRVRNATEQPDVPSVLFLAYICRTKRSECRAVGRDQRYCARRLGRTAFRARRIPIDVRRPPTHDRSCQDSFSRLFGANQSSIETLMEATEHAEPAAVASPLVVVSSSRCDLRRTAKTQVDALMPPFHPALAYPFIKASVFWVLGGFKLWWATLRSNQPVGGLCPCPLCVGGFWSWFWSTLASLG